MKLNIAAIMAAIIAVVVIVALWLTETVDLNINETSISFLTDKNPDKDTVVIRKIQGSQVEVESRQGQDINIEDVTDDSIVNVK